MKEDVYINTFDASTCPCSAHDLYDVYARMTRDVNLSTFFCFLCKLKIDDEVEEEERRKYCVITYSIRTLMSQIDKTTKENEMNDV